MVRKVHQLEIRVRTGPSLLHHPVGYLITSSAGSSATEDDADTGHDLPFRHARAFDPAPRSNFIDCIIVNVVEYANFSFSTAVGRHDGAADWDGRVADEKCDHFGERLRLDRADEKFRRK